MNPTVYVNGTALDLDEVEYRISLTHGRNDITAAPAPSDASMTLYGFRIRKRSIWPIGYWKTKLCLWGAVRR